MNLESLALKQVRNGQTNYHEYAISITKIEEIIKELKGEEQEDE